MSNYASIPISEMEGLRVLTNLIQPEHVPHEKWRYTLNAIDEVMSGRESSDEEVVRDNVHELMKLISKELLLPFEYQEAKAGIVSPLSEHIVNDHFLADLEYLDALNNYIIIRSINDIRTDAWNKEWLDMKHILIASRALLLNSTQRLPDLGPLVESLSPRRYH